VPSSSCWRAFLGRLLESELAALEVGRLDLAEVQQPKREPAHDR
jgi:hypothetical protein